MKNKTLIVLIGVVILRLLLIHVNVAEVGDSYNLLSAGEALKHWQYPLMEKRLPLLPLLLSFNRLMDPVLFGRVLVLIISLGTLLLTLKIYERLSIQKTFGWSILLLFVTQ